MRELLCRMLEGIQRYEGTELGDGLTYVRSLSPVSILSNHRLLRA